MANPPIRTRWARVAIVISMAQRIVAPGLAVVLVPARSVAVPLGPPSVSFPHPAMKWKETRICYIPLFLLVILSVVLLRIALQTAYVVK